MALLFRELLHDADVCRATWSFFDTQRVGSMIWDALHGVFGVSDQCAIDCHKGLHDGHRKRAEGRART